MIRCRIDDDLRTVALTGRASARRELRPAVSIESPHVAVTRDAVAARDAADPAINHRLF